MLCHCQPYLLRNDKHRNFSAVFAVVEYLLGFVLWRVKAFHFHLSEHLEENSLNSYLVGPD